MWPFPRKPATPAVVLYRPSRVLVEPIGRDVDYVTWRVVWENARGQECIERVVGLKFAMAFAYDLAGPGAKPQERA